MSMDLPRDDRGCLGQVAEVEGGEEQGKGLKLWGGRHSDGVLGRVFRRRG
jgi:hypothetical protein